MYMASRSAAQFQTHPFRSRTPGSAALQARPGQQTRQFVNRPVLNVLRRSPWAETLVHNYQFQSPGECVSNSEVMQAHILHALHRRHQIEIAGSSDPSGGLLHRLEQMLGSIKTPELDREYRHDPTVEDIVHLVEQHGPCVLALARMLASDQGGAQYAGHHAVLVIGTFLVDGRNWALVLDGNDLQNNPIMERVRAYADKYHDGHLERMTEGDLSVVQMEMDRAGEPRDSDQLVYSFIDLDKAVPEADKAYRAYRRDLAMNGGRSDLPPITFPNSICVATNTTVKAAAMPEPMKRELARIVASQPPDSSLRLKVGAVSEEL